MARIYDFAEFHVDRKADTHGWTVSMRGEADCPHLSLLFDENGHTVECKDCGKEVSAWWAFISIVERFQHEWDKLKAAQSALEKAEERVLTHKAAIIVEDAWRRHKYVPTCPHCSKPILPVDRFGLGGMSREYAEASAKPLKLKANLELIETRNSDK
jgi:hypothetical protein